MNLCVSIGIRIENPISQKDCLLKAQKLIEQSRDILEFEYSYFDIQCSEEETYVGLILCYENLENENEKEYLIESLQSSLLGNNFQNIVNNIFEGVSEINIDFTGDISKDDIEIVEMNEDDFEEPDFPVIEEPKEITMDDKIFEIVKEALERYDVFEEIDENENPYIVIEEDTVDEVILDCFDKLYPDIEPYTEDWDNLYGTIKDTVLNALNQLNVKIVESVDRSEYEMEEE